MIDPRTATLSNLLPTSPLDLHAAMTRKFGKNEREGPPRSSFVVGLLEQGVREKLDTRLLDVFAVAWTKATEVTKAIEESRSSPDTAENVDLYEHEITNTVHPELLIEFMGKRYPAIRLDFEMSAILRCANLEIRGGRIVSIQVGDISFRLRLLWEGKELIPEWTSQSIEVLEKIPLTSAA